MMIYIVCGVDGLEEFLLSQFEEFLLSQFCNDHNVKKKWFDLSPHINGVNYRLQFVMGIQQVEGNRRFV